MAKVVLATNHNRVFFEGPDDLAKAHVEANFPRHHVSPAAVVEKPEPDVHVLLDDGSEAYYVGEEWSSNKSAKSEVRK